MKSEVGVVIGVGGVEVSVDDGDGEAFGVKNVCKLKHGVEVTLQGERKKDQSATFALLQPGSS